MKPTRIDLCLPVQTSLKDNGYHVGRVLNAVNAALGEFRLVKAEGKTGDARYVKKEEEYNVRVIVSELHAGAASPPLLFDEWNSAVAKANKVASFATVAIPGVLKVWLDKFAKMTAEEKAKQDAIDNATGQASENIAPMPAAAKPAKAKPATTADVLPAAVAA